MAGRPRRIALVVIAVLVAGVCVRLGFWQLGRLQGRQRVNAVLVTREAAPPVDLAGADAGALAFARVTATGRYDVAHESILAQRSADGIPGNHVLTPLVLDDGRAVLVDRGWVPLEVDDVPVTGPAAAPSGRVLISGLALPPDAVSDPPLTPAPSLSTRIDLGVGGLPYELLPVYVLLGSQEPSQQSPAVAAGPTFDDGPHLGYALQWFAFAAIAVVGCVVLLVRDRRQRGIAATPDPLP